MKVKYNKPKFNKPNPNDVIEPLEEFIRETILFTDGYGGYSEKRRLEDQPTKLCEAFARLVNVLADKGVLSKENLQEILGYNIENFELVEE
jgi:hypothetical protein